MDSSIETRVSVRCIERTIHVTPVDPLMYCTPDTCCTPFAQRELRKQYLSPYSGVNALHDQGVSQAFGNGDVTAVGQDVSAQVLQNIRANVIHRVCARPDVVHSQWILHNRNDSYYIVIIHGDPAP